MSALAQCDAFAFIYDQAGDPAPDILVVLKRVIDASGNPILLGPKTTLTDSAGSFHFTLPELSTAFISARASALWNCPEGRAFTVPPGPSGELVPDFSLPASTLVEPPLVYVGDVLSIPKASATQDGYLSAADYAAFEAGGADVGVTQINTGTGLTGGPITETGTIAIATIPGVAGTWPNPTSITVNSQGQIISITSGAPDTIPPVISAITVTGITSTGAIVTWTTNEPATSQVEYGPTTGYGTSTMIDSSPVTSHSVPITGLAGATLYHYRVKSQDTALNLQTSGDSTFTTVSGPDITPPVISAVTAGSITDVGATITWTTDEASNSQVEYGLTTSYGSSTTPNPTMVTSHSVPLSVLAASTLYHYRVKSTDAASNLATSGDNTFTTIAPAPPDLLTSLVAFWKLDETGASANRVDSVGSNTLIAASPVNAVAGKFGNALQFIGDLHYLQCPSNSTLAMGASIDYTIAAWVQIADKTTDRNPLGKGAGVADEYIVSYGQVADRFSFVVQGNSGSYHQVFATSAGAPTVNTWYLVVAWHDATNGTINIQINNSPFDSAPQEEPPKIGGDALVIGCYGGGVASAWSGLIDEVAIWRNRLLSHSDILWLWNGGAGQPFGSW